MDQQRQHQFVNIKIALTKISETASIPNATITMSGSMAVTSLIIKTEKINEELIEELKATPIWL
ncbi:hypothetical protein ABDK00_014685 [Niabella insulamsoli]|uniref:hypothetical protein n=1 Tax=Niabella insulamsoli TaxID=3144874 RepID=UPI0031FD5F47